jgi:hypothetical protein
MWPLKHSEIRKHMRTKFLNMLVSLIVLTSAIALSQTDLQDTTGANATPDKAQQNAQATKSGKDGSASNNGNKTANQTAYSPNDSVSPPPSPLQFHTSKDLSSKCSDKKTLRASFNRFITNQSNAECLVNEIASLNADLLASVVSGKNNGLIVHVVTWTVTSKYQPTGGAWGFYRVKSQKGDLKQQRDLSGTPYLYGTPHVYLIDVNYFDDKLNTAQLTLAYDVETKARQKQNQSDLETLVSSLLKISGGGTQQADVNKTPEVWGTVFEVIPTVPVPYDITVTETLGDAQGVSAAASSVGCKPSPCSFAKTVTHYDTEYWDVSLGLAIPGPVETTYKSTTSSTGKSTLTPSNVTHTDAYAFADFYIFEHWAMAPTFLSAAPHVNVGIPITSQVFHRPYVGFAENIGLLTSKVKLNIPLSVFAGTVFMKQQIESPPGSQTLKWDRATKMMYGLELPISSITKYMKGNSNSNSNKTTSKSSNVSQPSSANSVEDQFDAGQSLVQNAAPNVESVQLFAAVSNKSANSVQDQFDAGQRLFQNAAPNVESVQLFAAVSNKLDETPSQSSRLKQINSRLTTKSVQLVRFNANALLANDVNVTAPGGKVFALSKTALFNTSKAGRAEADSRNFVWTGAVKEQNQGSTTLVSVNGQVSGSISSTKGLYRIEPLGGGLEALVEVDSTKFPKDEPATFEAKTSAHTRAQVDTTEYKADTPRVEIDVLVAYTPLAKAGTADIDGLIALAVAEANQSCQNSGIAIHLNMVDSFEVSYSETGKPFEIILSDFVAMPEVSQHRDQSGADVSVLLIDQSAYCGLADAILADAATAFAIVYFDCATGYYSFAHEIGHLLGARHNEQVDPTNQPFPYGHGYLHLTPPPEWRTIMAYDCPDHCNRLQYWSNPGLDYGGQPMGTVNTNDNARVLNSTAKTIAAFRSKPSNSAGAPPSSH